MIKVQTFVNLMKASWIFVDKMHNHPQFSYAQSGPMYSKTRRFGNAVGARLKRLQSETTKVFGKPECRATDMSIWVTVPATVIEPDHQDSKSAGDDSWSIPDGELLYQNFGHYIHSDRTSVECLVLLYIRPEQGIGTLICQTPQGVEIVHANCMFPNCCEVPFKIVAISVSSNWSLTDPREVLQYAYAFRIQGSNTSFNVSAFKNADEQPRKGGEEIDDVSIRLRLDSVTARTYSSTSMTCPRFLWTSSNLNS